jgi:hypothetical protein
MIIVLFILILSLNCLVNAFNLKQCNMECLKTCSLSIEINSKSCNNLCFSHCSNYNFEISKDQVKCLLLCYNMNLDKNVCDAVCKPYSKFNFKLDDKNNTDVTIHSKYGDGCTGNGRETCYKLCRLSHNGCRTKIKFLF